MKTEDDIGTAATATTAKCHQTRKRFASGKIHKGQALQLQVGSKRNFGYQGTVSITGEEGGSEGHRNFDSGLLTWERGWGEGDREEEKRKKRICCDHNVSLLTLVWGTEFRKDNQTGVPFWTNQQ